MQLCSRNTLESRGGESFELRRVGTPGSQSQGRKSRGVEENYFTEMCSGSEAGSYLRLKDFVYHSTLDLKVVKKKKMALPPARIFPVVQKGL